MDKLVNDGKIAGLCYDSTLTYEDSYKLLYNNCTNCIPSKKHYGRSDIQEIYALCGTQNPNYSAHKNSQWPRSRGG
jgi:hypothetical protein